MLKNYVIIALRNIWKHRTISFINIFGLAISMSVCLMLLIIITDQLSYDSFHNNDDRIYRVITDRTDKKNGDVWSTASTAYPLSENLKQHESVENLAAIQTGFSGIILKENNEVRFRGFYTDNHFFDIFNFSLEAGNLKEALSLPNGIILTKQLAGKLFKNVDPINQVIEIEGTGEFLVTGVLEEPKGKSQISFDALASVEYLSALEKEGKLFQPLSDWISIYNNYIYYSLKEGASPKDLENVFNKAAVENYDTESEYSYKFKNQPFNDIILGPELSNAIGFTLPRHVIYFLLLLSIIVLVLACLNYANLTTARALSRAKEIGLRKVIGAQKRHIISQFMIEAVIVSLVAFVFADIITQFLHPMLNDFISSQGAPMRFDEVPYTYPIFIIFGLSTGLIAGFVPSMILAVTNPLSALKKSIALGDLSNRFKIKGFSMRKILIVAQFVFTIFFVITIITVNEQMNYVMTKDHGFKVEGIINVPLNGVDYEKLEMEFNKLSVIHAVSATSHFPARGTNNNFPVYKAGETESLDVDYFDVDHGYVKSMGLKLVAGSDFTLGSTSIILNETAVKKLGYENPISAIGSTLNIWDDDLEIIGVLQDYNYQRLDKVIGSMALRNIPSGVSNMIVTISTNNKKSATDQMAEVWANITNRPFEYTFFEDDMRKSYGHLEGMMVVLGYVTFIVITLACLGLLGMVIFHVQYRTKEIGVRKTLGANHMNILFTIGKSFFIMIMISYLLGAPLAYLVNNNWLTSYPYRIELGISTMLTGFGFIAFVVAITIGSQLYKAMNLNPVDSLSNE